MNINFQSFIYHKFYFYSFIIALFIWGCYPSNLLMSDIKINMVQVSPGTFEMGTNKDLKHFPDEGPAHRVVLTREFEIGTTEITNEQFLAVMNWANANGKIWLINLPAMTAKSSYGKLEFPFIIYSQRLGVIPWTNKTLFRYILPQEGMGSMVIDAEEIDGKLVALPGREKLPAAMVSWYGAAAFCNFLGEIHGLDPLYDFNSWSADFEKVGFRLPTEAEWVWAYRGGINSKGFIYSGSNNVLDVAWSGEVHDRPRENRLPVASMKPNELGIYDMMGNVWEWTNDWAGGFTDVLQVDPKGPNTRLVGKQSWVGYNEDSFGKIIEVWKVQKGGDWQSSEGSLTAENRSFYDYPDEVNYDYPLSGFRIVRQLSK